MAINSTDDLITKLTVNEQKLILPWAKNTGTIPAATNWYHLWTVGGAPSSGLFYPGTDLTFTRTTDTTVGALAHGGNKAALTKHLKYVAAMSSAGVPGPILMLVDMVGYYPFATGFSGGSQVMDNTTGPDRYITAGQGGLQAVLVNGALNGATVNISTLTYVNQAGTGSQTMPTSPAVAVTGAAVLPTTLLGSRVLTSVGGPFIPLAAGDSGMNSITNITASGSMTGRLAMLMVKPLCTVATAGAYQLVEKDLVSTLTNLERVYDGACLSWLAFFPTATATALWGHLEVVWG